MDGRSVAARLRERLAQNVRALAERGLVPGLSVVLVGDDPASAVYVRAKARACREAGMRGETIRMPATTTEAELLAVVDRLNANPDVHGILVQMPLPKQIHADTVLRRIDPAKDVDGFHPVNVGRMLVGDRDGFVPCTPAGVMVLLREYNVQTSGAECVIVGRSNIVGKPMMALLVQPGTDATVTVCHSRSRNIADHTRRADIVIAAAGRTGLVKGDMIRPGAVVIDVGINRITEAADARDLLDDTRRREFEAKGSALVGDVHFPSVRERASCITPVPGGVGPLTIALLMKNTVKAAGFARPRAS